MTTGRTLEVGTEKWSVVVEVQTCDICLYWRGSSWWAQRLWQHPKTRLVHRIREYGLDVGHKTDCGLALPKDLPDARLRFGEAS